MNSYVNKALFQLPGPDKYNNEKSPKNKPPIYTMRQKTKILDKMKTLEPANDNPGPG